MIFKDFEKLYRELEKTEVLSQYFPKTLDLNIDLYDPIMDDLIELFLASQKAEKKINPDELFYILMQSVNRHITPAVRFQIFQRLESLLPEVSEQHQRIIYIALQTLPDHTIPSPTFALLHELYRNSLLKAMLQRADDDVMPVNNDVVEQVKAACHTVSEAQIESLKQNQDAAVAAIEWLFYETEDEKLVDSLLELAVQFNCYRCARLFFGCVNSTNWHVRYLADMVKNLKILPLVLDYVNNALDNKKTEMLDRWGYYDFLMGVNPALAFPYLRRELTRSDYWNEPRFKDEPEAIIEFYAEMTEWLIEIDDRRIVPVFIRFLEAQTSDSVMTEAKARVKDLVFASQWADEIKKGLRYLSEQVNIFIEAGVSFMDQINKENEEFYRLQKMIYGRPPTMEELQDHIKVVQNRWNESYHDELDGLRPTDVETSTVQMQLMQRMLNDFQKKNRRKNIPQEDMRDLMADFQNRWFLTPLPESGQIPTVLVFQSMEQNANTQALKEHYQHLKEERILSLYFQAWDAYENQEYAEAKKNLAALLALAPEHPFANWLKEKIPGK